jgi:sulfite reductase alpha subunit-like flavoprotein/nitric oxide synthase oxygenase domain/subunit/hemoglobin-like flavoprotein
MLNTQRIIHLTEISAIDFPPSNLYKYKCRVEMLSSGGETLLQRDLFTRMQPHWLVELKNRGDCTISIIFCCREGDITNPWQDVGTVTFNTQDCLNGERNADLELSIPNWEYAPQLKLKARLTQSIGEASNSAVKIWDKKETGLRQLASQDHRHQVDFELPPDTTLTSAEEVLVKDSWNKLRAWKELQMEKFLKRLLLEEPELEYLFGEAINGMNDFFYELFDYAVHQLQPETQVVIGEPLMGVPPDKGDSFDTIEDYGKLFADVGMRPHHWLTARNVWMWMLSSIPYLEDYDRQDLAKGANSALYRFFNTHVIIAMVKAIDCYDEAMLPEMRHCMVNSLSNLSQNHQQVGREFFQTLFEKIPYLLPIFGRTNMDYLSLSLFQALEFLVHCFNGGNREEMIHNLRLYMFNYIDIDRTGTISIDELTDFLLKLGLPVSLSDLKTMFVRIDTDGSGEIDFDEFDQLIFEKLEMQVNSFTDIPSCAYPAIQDNLLQILEKHLPDFTPELRQAWQVLIDRAANVIKLPKLNEERLLKKAQQYLDLISLEQAWEPEDKNCRWQEIREEVQATGTYTHSYEELAYGTQVAWRNASKCVGRIAWKNMVIRDLRHVNSPDQMFHECQEHVNFATNGGNLQITMSIFRPKHPQERWGPRFWNSQLYRYAAYPMPDGTVVGDPANLALTSAIIKFGWQPPVRISAYDILPLVIEVPGQEPKMYHWQPEEVLEVQIEHPTVPEFKDLGLRWYAIPVISNFSVHIGGLDYGCIPFNGWYMDTEIMRNFLDEYRYNKMAEIAQIMQLDSSSEQTLWRDRVALELNIAIIYSFQKAKVTIVDHQTAARQFLTHDLREKKAGRECPADWGWVVPAAGGSACPVWHHQMRDFYLEPAYHHAADRWDVENGMDLGSSIARDNPEGDKQDRILILYASETGTAEEIARIAARQLQRFRPKVMALDEYPLAEIASENFLLIVTSTFGNGEMPSNGKHFLQWVKQQPSRSLDGLNYAVLGIGSTVYEQFCAAGIAVDQALAKAGANCAIPLHKGDQIKDQTSTFKRWLGLISRVLGANETIGNSANAPKLVVSFSETDASVVLSRDSAQGVLVPLVTNYELLQEVIAGSRSTRCLVFDISGAVAQYETGDHVVIYPCNSSELVSRICDRLNVTGSTYFTTNYINPDGSIATDQPPVAVSSTVGQLLSEELDLSLREPFHDLLAYLHSSAPAPPEKQRLEVWLEILRQGDGNADAINLKKMITDNFLSVADLFDEFPSAQISLEALLELLPKQKPRIYSISSCPFLHPDKIQITVGVLQIITDAGKVRQGLCSSYLAGLEVGSIVRIGVRTSDFRPPTDPQAPMLMVGPGTGVSPLIAFLQHREALQSQSLQLGEACLYFGCRNHTDFLYADQLNLWQQQGILTDLQVAFSRLTEQKVYVQSLMQENAQSLWQFLSHPQCNYYVCGDAKMAEDVFEVFMAIAKTEGNLSRFEAVEFFDKMKKEKRFHTDVWGVQLNFKQAMQQLQKDNYSKAERWLERANQPI